MADEKELGGALSGGQIARTASLIMGALLLSGMLGVVRQVVISAAFGAGQDLDAFYAALRVPETLFVLVAGGALGSAFIPVFARFLAADDYTGAWKLASATLTYMLAGASLLSLIFFLAAEPVVKWILVPSAPADSQALTTELMRMMLVTVAIFGVSGLLMGILNGYQHFLAPALAPSLYNLGLIIGALAFAPQMGIKGLAWGAILGAVFHLLVQLPVVFRLPYLQLQANLAWDSSGAREVFLLMLPRVLGLGVVQVNFWVNAALTSGMRAGSLAALQTAFTLMFTILGILGQSIGTAIFPTLSRLHAEGDHKAFGQTLLGSLGGVLFLSLPAGLGLALLANPIITLLFERGEWTSRDTAGTAWALSLFSIGLAGHALLEILARAFYALHDTWTPVKIGGLTMLLNICLSLFFIQIIGRDADFERGAFGGLALSMSLATAIESSILWWLLRRRIGLADGALLRRALTIGLGAMVMALGVLLWRELAQGLPMLLELVGGILTGVGIFGAWSLYFKIEETQIILRRFRR